MKRGLTRVVELRKVQLTGGSSLTVTLPKAWTEKTKLNAGDMVGFLEQPDGSLALNSQLKSERQYSQYEIEVEDTHRDHLFRKIIAAYLMGFDAIRVTSKRPLTAEARQAIRASVRKIMGLEIVDEQPSAILVQDFLDPKEFQLDKAVRRMAVLTQAMQEEAAVSLRAPRPDLVDSVEDRDAEVDRLYWLVNKQFHAILRDSTRAAKMGLNASQALNFLLAARLIERTADHADRIAAEAAQLPAGKVPSAFLERMEKQSRRTSELFQLAVNNFFRKDTKKANEVIDEAERVQEGQKKLVRDASELGGETLAHLVFIIESIGRTAAYAADLSEVAINHKVAGET